MGYIQSVVQDDVWGEGDFNIVRYCGDFNVVRYCHEKSRQVEGQEVSGYLMNSSGSWNSETWLYIMLALLGLILGKRR